MPRTKADRELSLAQAQFVEATRLVNTIEDSTTPEEAKRRRRYLAEARRAESLAREKVEALKG